MRVLVTTDTVGGVWTFTQELTTGLLDRGHAVALFSLGRPPSPDQQSWADNTRIAFASRFTYVATDCALEWMQNNERAYAVAPELLRLAEDFNADLVHSNQFCFGALAAELPTVVTAHSDVLSWAAACRPEALATSPWLTRYKSLVRLGLDSASAVTAPTVWMLEALAANFDLPGRREVIANGRTLDGLGGNAGPQRLKPRFSKEPVGTAQVVPFGKAEAMLPGGMGTVPPLAGTRQLQAVTAGRLWDEAKNLQLLTQLASSMPLLVAGDPPPDPPAKLNFTGQLSQQALLDLFTRSALYLCPSLYEPFGLAPLEAALCGCAVLAHDIPPLREVWQDNAAYFTDAQSLSALLNGLAKDPACLKVLQTKSCAHAQKYSRARMTESYLRLYEELLEAHAA